MSKNWKGPIGPVTVKNNRGDTWVFPTLMDAVKSMNRRYYLVVERLPDIYFFGEFHDFRTAELKVVFLDECGIAIPLWRIDEESQGVELSSRFRLPSGPCAYDPERDFRNGPLPGRHRRRLGRCYRHMHTLAEIRDIEGLEADMRDAEDFPVRVKIRGRRKNIPTVWDDICPSRRGDGWKNYRRKQHKESQ